MTVGGLDAHEFAALHSSRTRSWNRSGAPAQPAPPDSPLLALVESNHWRNHRIWQMEDHARRLDCDDVTIAQLKRRIDRENQMRNDAIERIDDEIIRLLETASVSVRDDAEIYSETPGSIIDRMSVLSLRVHHMALQAERGTASSSHRAQCRDKHELLVEQSARLTHCLSRLLEQLSEGRIRLIPTPRFKMYNDPDLNPALHGAASAEARRPPVAIHEHE